MRYRNSRATLEERLMVVKRKKKGPRKILDDLGGWDPLWHPRRRPRRQKEEVEPTRGRCASCGEGDVPLLTWDLLTGEGTCFTCGRERISRNLRRVSHRGPRRTA